MSINHLRFDKPHRTLGGKAQLYLFWKFPIRESAIGEAQVRVWGAGTRRGVVFSGLAAMVSMDRQQGSRETLPKMVESGKKRRLWLQC